MIRRLFAIVVGLAGLFVLAMAAILAASDEDVEQTIANSRQIESMFTTVASYIDDFRKKEGRFPNVAELDYWKHAQPRDAYSVHEVFLESPGISKDLIQQHGMPPQGAYVLAYWRGEWFEYYASWARKTTLVFDKRSYYVLGSSIADGLAIATFAVLLLVLAGWLWRRPVLQQVPKDRN